MFTDCRKVSIGHNAPFPFSIAPDSSLEQQNSMESNISDTVPLMMQKMPQRPSIVIDSSQLPIQQEVMRKNSKDGLHMQSETMC